MKRRIGLCRSNSDLDAFATASSKVASAASASASRLFNRATSRPLGALHRPARRRHAAGRRDQRQREQCFPLYPLRARQRRLREDHPAAGLRYQYRCVGAPDREHTSQTTIRPRRARRARPAPCGVAPRSPARGLGPCRSWFLPSLSLRAKRSNVVVILRLLPRRAPRNDIPGAGGTRELGNGSREGGIVRIAAGGAWLVTTFAVVRALTGAIAASCALYQIGEFYGIAVGGYCFGLQATPSSTCGGIDGAVYIFPRLAFRLRFGPLLHFCRLLSPA